MTLLEIIAILASILLLVLAFFLWKKTAALQSLLNELQFKKQSQSVKYGKMTEQWIPFSEEFPYAAEQFRFLGNPIDGVVFTEDKVVFAEFKTNTSSLSAKQKHIKKLIQDKKVEWLEFNIKD